MMKKNYLFLLLSLPLSAFSQFFEAKYVVRFRANLNNESFSEENCHLLINKSTNNSYFFSENFYKKDSIGNLISKNRLYRDPSMQDPNLRLKTMFYFLINKDFEKKEIITNERIVTKIYTYPQEMKLKWEISDDTLTIDNYICQKATLDFEGRSYSCWFTTEIAISDGPFKFCGLPGLILEISDTEKHYNFKMVSFQKIQGIKFKKIYNQEKSMEVSFNNFRKIIKDHNGNPSLALMDAGLKLTDEQLKMINFEANIKKSNPIERL